MYVDVDSSGRTSVMELSEQQKDVIAEALVRLACCPTASTSTRDLAKYISLKLTQPYDYRNFPNKPCAR